MSDDNNMMARALLAQAKQKNLGIGIALTLFFGGLGLLYSSIKGGIILIIIEFVLFLISLVIALVTFGFGAIIIPILLFPCHVAAVICSIVTINAHNQKIAQEVLTEKN